MRVIGIDPGSQESAYIEWDGERIIGAHILANMDCATTIRATAQAPGRAEIALEDYCLRGCPVSYEGLQTLKWIGAFWAESGYQAQLVPYRAVSLHLCGIAGATSSRLYAALRERFGNPGTKKHPGTLYPVSKNEHLRSALAVALTATERET